MLCGKRLVGERQRRATEIEWTESDLENERERNGLVAHHVDVLASVAAVAAAVAAAA
jgi:hypothetical protein